MQACLAEARRHARRPADGSRTAAAATASAAAASGGGARRRRRTGGRSQKCLPARLRRFRTRFTTPSQTLRQVLNPPQTNITTTAYTIGGVDQTSPTMGVVTTAQVTKGRFLAPAGGKEALVATSYAAKHSLKVGSKLDLNGTSFTVVGLVSPPLGGQSADVYLPLKQLQTLANEKDLANVDPRAREASSSTSARVKQEIQQALPQAQVASSKDVADKISGSLVDASNLSHDLGFVLSIVAAAAAFLLAALLALSSVGKRVRELGTLKALGWTQRMVVRQIAGESLATGVLGGIFGIVPRRRGRARYRRVRAVADRELDDGGSDFARTLVSALRGPRHSTVSLTAPVGDHRPRDRLRASLSSAG